MRTVLAAAVQATPVFLDREATIEKACRLAKEAGGNGAELIVLPEAFVPGYPDWVWRSQPWKDARARYRRLLEASVVVGSPATEALAGAARDAGAYLCVGVNELDEAGGTLYTTGMCPGWSAIVEPGGSLLAGPLKEQEGILYAELDAGAARASRIEFDPVGHYARRDVFRLTVDTRPKPAVTSDPAPPDLSVEVP